MNSQELRRKDFPGFDQCPMAWEVFLGETILVVVVVGVTLRCVAANGVPWHVLLTTVSQSAGPNWSALRDSERRSNLRCSQSVSICGAVSELVRSAVDCLARSR